jgi:hypothetical protein
MKQSSSHLFVLCLATVWLLASSGRSQSVTLDFSAGRLYDSTGTLLPDGTLVVLVADTLENGFGTLQAGTVDVGNFLNGDNQVLARGAINGGFFGAGTARASTGPVDLESDDFSQLSTDDPLAVIWFPGLDASSFSFTSGASYGLFTDVDWIIPAAGSTESFQFLTIARGGDYAETLGRANLIAVPEPSACAALAGLCALGLGLVRRRRVGHQG